MSLDSLDSPRDHSLDINEQEFSSHPTTPDSFRETPEPNVNLVVEEVKCLGMTIFTWEVLLLLVFSACLSVVIYAFVYVKKHRYDGVT
mmetsp:Transcript_15580/g.39871  ORF Transcript_15580/g.39871 Transcript_15580/m.39871 type:complete len:88 (-) Transcript_15580:1727-1990(-)